MDSIAFTAGLEPETGSDWLFQVPLLSVLQTRYWSAPPFCQTTW